MGDLHARDFESFRGYLWAAWSPTFGSGRTIISQLDGFLSHVFSEGKFGLNKGRWKAAPTKLKHCTVRVLVVFPQLL